MLDQPPIDGGFEFDAGLVVDRGHGLHSRHSPPF
jgi:hypothetical protein